MFCIEIWLRNIEVLCGSLWFIVGAQKTLWEKPSENQKTKSINPGVVLCYTEDVNVIGQQMEREPLTCGWTHTIIIIAILACGVISNSATGNFTPSNRVEFTTL